MSYRDRQGGLASDGSPTFSNQQDLEADDAAIVSMQEAWGCEIHRFGVLSPIDFFATRHGRLSAVIEHKSRSHDSTRFPTVFLNVRKWLSLQLAHVGLGVPALFVVTFTDGMKWIDLAHVDATRAKIGGCASQVKARSDVEPVIEVVVSSMSGMRRP